MGLFPEFVELPALKTKRKLLFGKKVLLIEDDEVDQMLLKFMVEEQGAEFFLEPDKDIALDRMAKEHMDLVLLDTRIENTNMLEFTRELRAVANSGLSIIGMSSVDMRGRGISQGLDEVMIRPVEYSKFVRALHKLQRK